MLEKPERFTRPGPGMETEIRKSARCCRLPELTQKRLRSRRERKRPLASPALRMGIIQRARSCCFYLILAAIHNLQLNAISTQNTKWPSLYGSANPTSKEYTQTRATSPKCQIESKAITDQSFKRITTSAMALAKLRHIASFRRSSSCPVPVME
jgi:hypothetical protein